MPTVLRSLRAIPGAILVVMLGAGLAYAGVTPAQKCEASQLKAVGKDAVCQANQLAKGVLGGTTDLTKCTTSFDTAFMSAEVKGGCLTILDAAQTESRVSGAIKNIRAPLEGSCAPKTACGLSDCGLVSDGCGGTLDCGVCENPCSSDADCINTRVCEPVGPSKFCEPKLTDFRPCFVENECLSECCCDVGGFGNCVAYTANEVWPFQPGVCVEPTDCSVSGAKQCPGASAPAMTTSFCP